MIKLLPAIDLIDNKCVRLLQGDYSRMTDYGLDPIQTAKLFQLQGADILHLVDLQGAKQGTPVHFELIKKIKDSLTIPVEVGGGIRDIETVEQYLSIGVERIILGTILIKDKDLAISILKKYPNNIVFGIDGRGDSVAVSGWLENTDISVVALIKEYEKYGLKHVIYTDINKDGLLQGTNLEMLSRIIQETNVKLVASGGVSSLEDINDLIKINRDNKLFGIITGKAVYENKFTVKEAKELIINGTIA
ncbi:MAG: 1-(5-phosphoribosyl)-5-[(5-phosphoribosylamino)methylideneamino]imidazole-4-carboxamide isomerase [Candidatus Margulisbacteria bacterium]|nr:1-(5-phosphoribosyl)-5-[(5-phosphoribosylamino)methylideneamino]imidazole-4-carboxamide isomerase [Candidatus Margulisiibacteriota bacterium]